MALPYQGYGYNPYQYGQVNPLQPQMDRLAQMQAQYQQPQQMQQVNQGILWVQGEAGAKSYLVAPNTSVLLMDSENSNFYIKTTDAAGMLEQFQQFRKEMEGRNPNEEINRLLQSGKINQQQLNQAQQMAQQMQGMFKGFFK